MFVGWCLGFLCNVWWVGGGLKIEPKNRIDLGLVAHP